MTNIEFDPGIRRVDIVDNIENTHFEVQTPERIDPIPVHDDEFYFPVEHGVSFEASGISVPQYVSLYVYDLDREALAETTAVGEDTSIPEGHYEIDLPGNPMKIYLQVEAEIQVIHENSRTTLLFDRTATVRLGARSLHERPAGTVTGTADPAGLMEAVSAFSSSLKTHSPERSFPSLRGHPPELTIGPEVKIPGGLEPPSTGVEIGIEPSLAQVYTAAPLAFYLGAELVPTDGEPYVDAGGTRIGLDRGSGVPDGIHATLERQLVFDCVLRTEGLYSPELAEREVMEAATDLDFAAVYDRPLAERIAICLELPDAVFDRPSAWHLVADVSSSVSNAAMLPYFVNDLAHVRSGMVTQDAETAETTPDEIKNFLRRGSGNHEPTGTVRTTYRDSGGQFDADQQIVTPPESNALGHAWADEHFPIGAAKTTLDTFRRRHDATLEETILTEVTVVCNDEEMREESDALYGFRDLINLSVDVHFDLEREELRSLLEEKTDFLHYIGHVDEEGMRCPDGPLDLQTLDSTGVELFFLNACESFDQGMALLDAGARGGIVTVNEVYNVIATKFGRRVARLMDAGFDLYGALDVGQDGTLAGGSYAIVGDGRAQLCEPTDGIPVLHEIETDSSGRFSINSWAYPTVTYDVGTMGHWHFDDSDLNYLTIARRSFSDVATENVELLLEENNNPLQIDGTLRWSDNVTVDDLV